jgi:hypothetical protein
MTLEQAFQNVAMVCEKFRGYGINEPDAIKASLAMIHKSLFPPKKVEEPKVKEDEKD